MKFVGFGEMGVNKITEPRRTEVREGRGNCIMENV
jgi:hypothetical protein